MRVFFYDHGTNSKIMDSVQLNPIATRVIKPLAGGPAQQPAVFSSKRGILAAASDQKDIVLCVAKCVGLSPELPVQQSGFHIKTG
jgi:hypothetical protein